MRRPLALILAVIPTYAASVAQAAPTARLVYSRTADADSCPNEDALRRAVAARIGYDAFFAWAKRTVTASIARRGDAFVAKVDLIDEDGIDHGAREIQAPGACSDLLDAVALTIAIAIDPQSLASPGPNPPPAPEPPSAGPPPPLPVVELAFFRSARRSPPARARVIRAPAPPCG